MRLFWGSLLRRSRATTALVLANVSLLMLLYHGAQDDGEAQYYPEAQPGVDHRPNDHLRSVHEGVNQRAFNDSRETDYNPQHIGTSRKFHIDTQSLVPVTCSNITPPYTLSEPNTFHQVQADSGDTYVFAAYYDPRTDPPALRIMGLAGGQDPAQKFCQVWYQHRKQAEIYAAEYHIVPETHDMKYAASIHVCYIHRKEVPYAVSLVNNKCDKPTHALRVDVPMLTPTPHINFTICVSPLNLDFNKATELTEMIELNRILGADKIAFYNYSSGADVHKILDYYAHRGLVDVIPWPVPVPVNTWPLDPNIRPEVHYFAQVLALNDCLYRYMFTSKYIVFTDLDEFIIPRRHLHWAEMLNHLTCPSATGAFIFQNVFFRKDWQDTAIEDSIHTLGAVTLMKTLREKYIWPHYSRSKYIVVPRLTIQVGIHFVFEFIDNFAIQQCDVPEELALLHHYRSWLDDEASKGTRDTSMYRFKDILIKRMHTTLRETKSII